METVFKDQDAYKEALIKTIKDRLQDAEIGHLRLINELLKAFDDKN